MTWYIYDPDPVDGETPKLYGPFPSNAQANEYANLLHPDDESGNTVVLTPTPVDA